MKIMFDKQKNICDKKIYESIFALYAKDLRNFLLYKFKDLETAEDIVQDCFVKLWENCKEVRIDKVKSYLFTIGNNMFLNIKKHEQVVRKHQQKNITQDRNIISPEFIMIEDEYAQKLQKLIEALPDKQKIVFVMSRIEKKKYKEIAQELDISIKTVEKRMSLALLYLRNNLDYFK